jgi:hypothetical protein
MPRRSGTLARLLMPAGLSASNKSMCPWISTSFFLEYLIRSYALEKLNLHSLLKRWRNLDALSFVQVYRGLKSCPALLETSVLLFVSPLAVLDTSCLVFAPQLNIFLMLGPPSPCWSRGAYIHQLNSNSFSQTYFIITFIDFSQPPYCLLVYIPTFNFLCFLRQGANITVLISLTSWHLCFCLS